MGTWSRYPVSIPLKSGLNCRQNNPSCHARLGGLNPFEIRAELPLEAAAETTALTGLNPFEIRAELPPRHAPDAAYVFQSQSL